MATTNNGDFSLAQTGYMTFDSLSLKQVLKDRLTQNGVFTDQVYEGSNISQIIDILAYTFNTLIYYLNRTSSEAVFTDAQVYENINRIVKALGYNPLGKQTSLLSFTCSADSNIIEGIYTIPRYSYLTLGSFAYSFNEDITFFKAVSGVEYLEDFSTQKLFYQGRYLEYPIYTATGDENELIYLLPGDNVIIDHFNVDVYVKNTITQSWKKWEKTTSLYLEIATDEKYEIRLNDSKHYEIRFGDNINGKKLNKNDQVAIYYLKSDGIEGEVGVNALQAGKLVKYDSTQFDEIFNSVQLETITFLPTENYGNILFDNQSSSTYYSQEESVDDIRNHAPANFRSQYRLVTESDFESYIKSNFSNLIHDVKCVNNWSYLSKYLKYFYNLGITNPNNIGNVLFNQVTFADSCNFNNVYLYIVPKIVKNSKTQISYLNPSLKALITNSIQDVKILTCEPVTIDPIYMTFDVGISKNSITPSQNDVNNTELVIIQDMTTKRDALSIKNDVYNIFFNYFDINNCKLGQVIDINYLNNAILAIAGIKTFYTRRIDDNTVSFNGLSLIMWNPIYPIDIKFIAQNQTLNDFQFPYLNNFETFINKITVQSSTQTFENIEY